MPTNRVERALHGGCHLTTLLNPSGVNTPALPTPHHILALDLGQTGPGRILNLEMQRRLVGVGYGPGGAAATSAGANSVCTNEAAHFNLSSRSAPTPNPHLVNAPAPPTPHHSLALDHTTLDDIVLDDHNRGRDTTWVASEWTCRHLHRQCHQISVSAQASLTSILLSFGAKHTLKGNRVCLSPTLRTSAQAAGEPTPPQQTSNSYGAERKFHLTCCIGF